MQAQRGCGRGGGAEGVRGVARDGVCVLFPRCVGGARGDEAAGADRLHRVSQRRQHGRRRRHGAPSRVGGVCVVGADLARVAGARVAAEVEAGGDAGDTADGDGDGGAGAVCDEAVSAGGEDGQPGKAEQGVDRPADAAGAQRRSGAAHHAAQEDGVYLVRKNTGWKRGVAADAPGGGEDGDGGAADEQLWVSVEPRKVRGGVLADAGGGGGASGGASGGGDDRQQHAGGGAGLCRHSGGGGADFLLSSCGATHRSGDGKVCGRLRRGEKALEGRDGSVCDGGGAAGGCGEGGVGRVGAAARRNNSAVLPRLHLLPRHPRRESGVAAVSCADEWGVHCEGQGRGADGVSGQVLPGVWEGVGQVVCDWAGTVAGVCAAHHDGQRRRDEEEGGQRRTRQRAARVAGCGESAGDGCNCGDHPCV